MGKPVYEQNPYVRKHIHRWKITKRTPAVTGGWGFDWVGNQSYDDPKPMRLVRECEDCSRRESAEVPDETVLVPGHENIADVEWKETV